MLFICVALICVLVNGVRDGLFDDASVIFCFYKFFLESFLVLA